MHGNKGIRSKQSTLQLIRTITPFMFTCTDNTPGIVSKLFQFARTIFETVRRSKVCPLNVRAESRGA